MSQSGALKDNDFKPNYIHFLLFFILFFSNQMDFRDSEVIIGARIDIQVFIRLGVLAIFTLSALWYWQRFVVLCRQIPLFVHFFYLAYLACVSANMDTISFYSYYALATHIAMCITIVVMMEYFGKDNFVFYYFIGVSIFCSISLMFYFFFPDIGKYTYWQDGVLFESSRLKGIAGHPNTLGFMAATGLIAAFHSYYVRYPISKTVYVLAAIILYSLILTNSRSSLAFLIITLVIFILIHSRSLILTMPLISLFAIIIAVGFDFFKTKALDMLVVFSRSGSSEEITSVTGRSNIWNMMIELIEQKPIFGWGHANLEPVLFKHADEIGFSVGQAHNLYLQTAFAGGIVGLGIFLSGMLVMLIISTIRAYRYQVPFDFCVIVFILFAGITESIILTTVSGNNYLVFMMVVASTAIYCKQTQNNIKPRDIMP